MVAYIYLSEQALSIIACRKKHYSCNTFLSLGQLYLHRQWSKSDVLLTWFYISLIHKMTLLINAFL